MVPGGRTALQIWLLWLFLACLMQVLMLYAGTKTYGSGTKTQ